MIYCDPPYKNASGGYYKCFGSGESDRFYDWVREMSKPERNNTVIVSEYWAPEDFTSVWSAVYHPTVTMERSGTVTEHLFCHQSRAQEAMEAAR